ncbi:hypothetical protein [Parahaliea mediterranea]|uniref:Uncharacterized protein n=1 Tax=Parahaliea mediterranea TaxID=651086 RepID=A0A939DGH5_9GAMM|nr:hypothetical protein [Parahaliea mediterranea]MBN7797680.1 hypothetical protein [Parahaliea mediterranea]
MGKPLVLSVVAFVAVVTVAAALFWLTYDGGGADQHGADACASTKRDIGAAVLADSEGDQDALVNRAIIVRGKCEQDERD